jgi:predicted nucleotide-binding protein (sugar kinase/HSP70/actin superfamily)
MGPASSLRHFRRPIERPFTARERHDTTILFGGLTASHERLIAAVFEGSGYRCQRLPTTDLHAFHRGREYCNPSMCNPVYFTIGALLEALYALERQGLSRQEIVDRYVFFTAGSCGPCRFGMYEAEFRLALENAGFEGFRVLLFQQDDGVKAEASEPGLKLSLNIGLGALNAFNIGDVLQDLAYQIRPYEVVEGETDRALDDCLNLLAQSLVRGGPAEPVYTTMPPWLSNYASRHKWLAETINILGKLHFHLYSPEHLDLLARCRERLDRVEVDRTRVKPVVKITGEFWAQTTESAGNYSMFSFLEREGAHVIVEPIGTWVMYLLYQEKEKARIRRRLDVPYPGAPWWHLPHRALNARPFLQRVLLVSIAEAFYARQFDRVAQKLGGLTAHLAPQRELARLAHPFYHSMARGGEGHLEVGKNVYYTLQKRCHMVLSLKPFGCLPSSQSDGVQSAVVNRFKDMIFVPIETSGEGEVYAHSRAQMALSDAKLRAREEFNTALQQTGRRLADIRAYVAERPELRRPFYHVPARQGIAGMAANFVLHVSELMNGGRR